MILFDEFGMIMGKRNLIGIKKIIIWKYRRIIRQFKSNSTEKAILEMATPILYVTNAEEKKRIAAKAFIESGFIYNTESIAHFKDEVLWPACECISLKEGKLVEKMKQYLIRNGATEMELKWFNLNNVNFSFIVRQRTKFLERRIDMLRISGLPILYLSAHLNRKRKEMSLENDYCQNKLHIRD